MKVSLDSTQGNTIVAYDIGQIQVHRFGSAQSAGASGQVHIITTSSIITPEQVIENWQPQNSLDLSPLHMEPVLAFQPEIIILGTGRLLNFPAAEVITVCHEAGAGFEVMDTGAACRTYNILAAEGRRVAAALLMIDN